MRKKENEVNTKFNIRETFKWQWNALYLQHITIKLDHHDIYPKTGWISNQHRQKEHLCVHEGLSCHSVEDFFFFRLFLVFVYPSDFFAAYGEYNFKQAYA